MTANHTPDARRIPDPVALRRSVAGRAVRLVYGALMLVLAAILGWFMVKPLIYVSGPGTSIAPKKVISLPFVSRVSEVHVTPGEIVDAGTLVATVESPEAEMQQAAFLDSLGEMTSAEARLQIELAIAQSSLEESERREELVSSMLENINEHEDSTSRRYRMEVMREFSDAKINYERFRAQIETSKVQLKRIEAQRERLEKTAAKLERIFNEGHATAPERGLVSETLAYPGQTVKPGEPIAEIYDISERYLEWALPPNGLRHPEPGDPVYVVHGSRVFEGEVVDIVPMSVNRSDVDTIFAKNVVGQLVKVRPKNTQDLPPLLSHCDVRYNYWRSLDGIVRLFVGTMVAVGIWEQP